MMESKPVLLNFSGHPLSEGAIQILRPRFRAIETIPFDNIKFDEDVDAQLKTIVMRAKTPLDGSIPVTLILPGHSTIAVLLIVYLIGLLGSVPNLCLVEPVGFGNYSPTNIFHLDLHKIRVQARAFRQEMLQAS